MTELEKLDPGRIFATARRLHDRVDERFPRSGLSDVADQLVELASRAGKTCAELAKPNMRLRVVSYAVIALVVTASVAAVIVAVQSADHGRGLSWAELVQAGEAAANDIVLLGAAIYFFVSFETRLKRGKVVKALHQLRTLAHLIDAHQLTKTPEVVGHEDQRTKSSPERTLSTYELTRYLDYCSEMLSLTGKIAALYGDGFDDSESLEAVNEIEEITIGLQGKIWQKLILLHAISPAELLRGKGDASAVEAARVELPIIDVPQLIADQADAVEPEPVNNEPSQAIVLEAQGVAPQLEDEPACVLETETIEPQPMENE